jgi:BirA family biotin operon repressor/biotin-[acetyl-CoA-carboxylase] ligase
MTTMPDTSTLNLAAIEAAVAGTQFAGQMYHLRTTTSTSDVAMKAALAGARTGVWIADQQIAGRGRGRHTWHSPVGAGIYVSALVAPAIPMQFAPSLSLRIAIAAQSAIASTFGFRAPDQIDIRWPNDLLLNRKKCGGILIDTASNPATPTQPATLRYAVIGIGINLNHSAWITGKRVRVEARDKDPGGYTGTTAGLDPHGFLLVQADDGQFHTVLSGGLREL